MVGLYCFSGIVSAAPNPADDLNAIYFDTPFYDPNGSKACSASPAGNGGIVPASVDGDNVNIAYHFFVSNGYSPAQSAGIVGNFMYEAPGPPVVNPADTNSIGAHGIAQWLGGRKTELRVWVTAEGKDPESLAGQLDFVIHELQTSNTGARDKLKLTTDPRSAALSWFKYYERAGDSSGPARADNAANVFTKYGNDTTGTTTALSSAGAASSSCSGAVGSVDLNCPTATGGAKILCAAERFDPLAYVFGGGHGASAATFMQHFNSGRYDGLDCSSLVGIAVYNAFGVDDIRVSSGYASDKNWQAIPVDQATTGDLLWSYGHVEFVVENKGGGNFRDFGAHTANAPLDKQIGFDNLNVSNFPDGIGGALRYIGPGSVR
ncbi:MAG: phage tail tip lysozyme [Patescibacteria group bacterium]|nr:phage tail tip lysozyme [Patescibacteria group bacterium]